MSYTTEMLRPDDQPEALLPLWAQLMSESQVALVGEKRLEWLYGLNPVGPAQTCLGIHESDGVIACGSIIPRRITLGGRVVDAGMLSDFAVDKNHRTAGPAIKLQRALASHGTAIGLQFLYSYPNYKAVPIFKRLRYLFVGKAQNWVKPLHSEYKIRKRLNNPLLIKAASAVVDVGLRANDARVFLRRPRWFRTEITSRADRRFDDLWEKAKPRLITSEKSSAYMNWRYAEHPTDPHRFCLVFFKGDLIGYTAYAVHDNKVIVSELFCDLDRDIHLVLCAFTHRMRRLGYDSIVLKYVGNDLVPQAMAANNFLLRPGERTLFAYLDKSAPTDLRERISDLQNWCLFDGELDI